MRIQEKLRIHTVVVACLGVVLSCVTVGTTSYFMSKKALRNEVENQLISIREMKKDQIEKRFQSLVRTMTLLASDPMLINAMKDFAHAFDSYAQEAAMGELPKIKEHVVQQYLVGFVKEYQKQNVGLTIDPTPLVNFKNDTTFLLQYQYIFNNPNPLSHEDALTVVNDGSAYSRYHQQYHPRLREILKEYGFYDIALVDSHSGTIVYSTFKDLDFTTSLKNGPYLSTPMGEVFAKANTLPKNRVVFGDFIPYVPAFDNPIGFVATPIKVHNATIGVLLIKLPVSVVNDTMTNYRQWEEYGLGATGETYLVGQDNTMRSQSRFFIEDPKQYLKAMRSLKVPEKTLTRMAQKLTSIGLQRIDTPGVHAALQGETGVAMYQSYRNTRVLAAYTPLAIPGLHWGLVCEQDASEVFEPIMSLARQIMVYTLIILCIIIALSVFLGSRFQKSITQPLGQLRDLILELSKTQNLTQRIRMHSNDELSEMADAINGLLDALQNGFQDMLHSSDQLRSASKELKGYAKQLEEYQFVPEFSEGLTLGDGISEGIKSTSHDISNLSERLRGLSHQFQVLENETDKTRGW